LKPLSVTLPFAARFTRWETAKPCAKRIPNQAKAKTVTVAKRQKGDAGAAFDLAPELGSVSDRRAANGGVAACVKKAKKTT
jgi:xanthine dehydrogenase iron-sulfur cluster and FAD-binding subunit A